MRLKETEATARGRALILGASLYRTELRLSHFREDFPDRDDENWLFWVDVEPGDAAGTPRFRRTPVPTPLCAVTTMAVRPNRLKQSVAVGGV